MSHRIDEIDRLILYHLSADARNTTAPRIAEEVDVTPATIRNRIRQLEESGIIQGYHAVIDYETTNGKFTTEFTCTAPVSERSRLADEALATPGVINVRELLAGQENLVVTAVGTDTDDINRIAHDLSTLGIVIEREDILLNERPRPYEAFGPGEDRTRSAVRDFQHVAGGAEVVEFTIAEDAAVTGRTLAGATEDGIIPDDVLVVSIERGDERLTPDGATRIEPGDVVSVFSPEALSERLLSAFDGSGADADRQV